MLSRDTEVDESARILTNRQASEDFDVEIEASINSSGCVIQYSTYDHANETPSYVNHIAPILQGNCAGCHRDGGVAPFAMDSHLMVKG